mgnify:CR=1 FL=1
MQSIFSRIATLFLLFRYNNLWQETEFCYLLIAINIYSFNFYIEKLGLLRLRIVLLKFPTGSLVQQSPEMAGMLRTNHDASSTRDTFLFVCLVRFLHGDSSHRAHICTGMAGCTFALASFRMQRNRLGITIRAIAFHHQTTDGRHL